MTEMRRPSSLYSSSTISTTPVGASSAATVRRAASSIECAGQLGLVPRARPVETAVAEDDATRVQRRLARGPQPRRPSRPPAATRCSAREDGVLLTPAPPLRRLAVPSRRMRTFADPTSTTRRSASGRSVSWCMSSVGPGTRRPRHGALRCRTRRRRLALHQALGGRRPCPASASSRRRRGPRQPAAVQHASRSRHSRLPRRSAWPRRYLGGRPRPSPSTTQCARPTLGPRARRSRRRDSNPWPRALQGGALTS